MPQFQPVVLAIAVAILVVALTALARRLPVPTPILQVLAGFVVTIVPGIAIPALDPDLVFFVFLPSILWSAAMFTSVREFRRNAVSIGALAIGLVLVTTAIVSRLPVPRRVITMLEGESLVNDASALVLYRTAVAALRHAAILMKIRERPKRRRSPDLTGTARGCELVLQSLRNVERSMLSRSPSRARPA